MDIGTYVRVIWRFRQVVALGVLLALALATLSVFKVHLDGGMPGLAYRSSPTFQSQATLFVTERGFPWGRSLLPVKPTADGNGAVPQYADTPRFNTLAILYSHLANGDDVQRLMRAEGPLGGTVQAAPVPSDDGNGFIPFINLTAQSDSGAGAAALANRAADSLRRFIGDMQKANGIPVDERVQLPLVKRASAATATIVEGRKLTMPIAVFVLVMAATIWLAFLLENLRPSVSWTPQEVAFLRAQDDERPAA